MNLTKKEQAWLERFQKTMAAAPKSLNDKISSFTIGDDNITLYDKQAQDEYEDSIDNLNIPDKGVAVDRAGTEFMFVRFPFAVESTAG